MQTIITNSSPLAGRTSRPPWETPHEPLACKGCGSSLQGRREAVRGDTTKGIRFITEVFRCRCGRGRHIQREVVA